MKTTQYIYSLLFLIYAMTACITEYEASGIEAMEDVLVVDGIITNDETYIVLSKTIGLTNDFIGEEYIGGASIYVECEDGTQSVVGEYLSEGKYKIKNGPLEVNKKYRIHILWNKEEYVSEYLFPLFTPEIDDIELTKKGPGETVYTTVSTHDPEDKTRYYLWKYQEHWEVKAELFATVGYEEKDGKLELIYYDISTSNNKYYCWGKDSSKVLLLGNADTYLQNIIPQHRLISISPDNDKLSRLYYVRVHQNQIRREAYEYYSNLQKNVERTSGLFSSMPSEMNGNIVCLTQPTNKVVGYVEVSNTTSKEKFFTSLEEFYESERGKCSGLVTKEFLSFYNLFRLIPDVEYAPITCFDCRLKENASKEKPSFWPSEYK